MAIRQVKSVVGGHPTSDGAGVKLIRVLSRQNVVDIDPFLMMDAFDSTNPSDYLNGFPMHPHRGIETVTYLIHGRIAHEDSLGNAGVIGPGDSQWMTSGSGILHQEMPQRSDRLFGLQMWLNLPAKEKMTAPTYFDITPDMIGTQKIPQGTVRVVAGRFGDAHGVEPPHVKATMLDITLLPNQEITFPVDGEANLFIYLLEGSGVFDTEKRTSLSGRFAAIYGPGDELYAHSEKDGARFMVFYGRPLHEPVAWGGPIVMNTEKELQQAFMELQNNTFIKRATK